MTLINYVKVNDLRNTEIPCSYLIRRYFLQIKSHLSHALIDLNHDAFHAAELQACKILIEDNGEKFVL